MHLTAENIIWNNKLIKIDGKSIYYQNYAKAGILLTNQMQFDKGSLESYNIATNAGLRQSNFLMWAGIRSAIHGHLKFFPDNNRKIGLLEFCCGEKVFDPVLCKSKQFCEFLITKKGIVSKGFTKLKNDFDLDDITVSKVFLNLTSVSSETFIRSFQLRLLDDIAFTNKRLVIRLCSYMVPVRSAKWKQKPSIIYFTNVLLLFFFGKILKTSGLYFQVKGKNSLYKMFILVN